MTSYFPSMYQGSNRAKNSISDSLSGTSDEINIALILYLQAINYLTKP